MSLVGGQEIEFWQRKENSWAEGYLIGVTHGRLMFTMRRNLRPSLCADVCQEVLVWHQNSLGMFMCSRAEDKNLLLARDFDPANSTDFSFHNNAFVWRHQHRPTIKWRIIDWKYLEKGTSFHQWSSILFEYYKGRWHRHCAARMDKSWGMVWLFFGCK